MPAISPASGSALLSVARQHGQAMASRQAHDEQKVNDRIRCGSGLFLT
jgi:hypothetical protein